MLDCSDFTFLELTRDDFDFNLSIGEFRLLVDSAFNIFGRTSAFVGLGNDCLFEEGEFVITGFEEGKVFSTETESDETEDAFFGGDRLSGFEFRERRWDKFCSGECFGGDRLMGLDGRESKSFRFGPVGGDVG